MFITKLNPFILLILGTLFTWGMTLAGASSVFLFKNVNKKILDFMLGFAAGVMIAASFWSLLAPSIKLSEELGFAKWIPPLIGFLLGGFLLRIIDLLTPHLHVDYPLNEKEGIKTNWKRTTLLVIAITIHNIPEGLAVGVAFGSLTNELNPGSIMSAIALTLGIGIQNFPEGVAVALPLKRDGLSALKSFWYGQLSGLVEPIAGLLGFLAVMIAKPILPYALSFAAGAMIYVVAEEVIPEAERSKNTDIATIGVLLGFAVMMVLDVALG